MATVAPTTGGREARPPAPPLIELRLTADRRPVPTSLPTTPDPGGGRRVDALEREPEEARPLTWDPAGRVTPRSGATGRAVDPDSGRPGEGRDVESAGEAAGDDEGGGAKRDSPSRGASKEGVRTSSFIDDVALERGGRMPRNPRDTAPSPAPAEAADPSPSNAPEGEVSAVSRSESDARPPPDASDEDRTPLRKLGGTLRPPRAPAPPDPWVGSSPLNRSRGPEKPAASSPSGACSRSSSATTVSPSHDDRSSDESAPARLVTDPPALLSRAPRGWRCARCWSRRLCRRRSSSSSEPDDVV